MEKTQGNWRVGDAGQTIFGPKTDKPCPEIIATLGKNFKENARLIASAPELLDLLDRIITASETDNCGLINGEAVLCRNFELHGRSLINKVKGEN